MGLLINRPSTYIKSARRASQHGTAQKTLEDHTPRHKCAHFQNASATLTLSKNCRAQTKCMYIEVSPHTMHVYEGLETRHLSEPDRGHHRRTAQRGDAAVLAPAQQVGRLHVPPLDDRVQALHAGVDSFARLRYARAVLKARPPDAD